MQGGPSNVLSFAEARRTVEAYARQARPAEVVLLRLLDGLGLVLAEDAAADRDFPPFPRATRDGYAVRSADVESLPARLQVIGEVRAGFSLPEAVGPVGVGQAVEIMTGAPVPKGADAVVMVEFTSRQGDAVEVGRAARAGENVVPQGSEARAGARLVERGTRLRYSQIGLLAAVGLEQVRVYRRPRVALLSTGDEVVDIAAQPGPFQIRNSNSYSLAAQVRQAGAEAAPLPVAPDEPEALRRLLKQGLGADLLLVMGGVSMGKYDLVEQVLGEFQVEFFFTGAQIQPGRPVVFGRARQAEGARPTYFLGLPGNPISTMVTFELFARPLIDGLSGAAPEALRFLRARLKTEVRARTGLTRFLPARLCGQLDEVEVAPVPWQGSGDLAAMARADCYLVVPPDRETISVGELVSVLMR